MGLLSKLNARQVFILDGCGALLTASLLYFAVFPNEDFFGMPRSYQTMLVGAAMAFAAYSLGCAYFSPPNWGKYLKAIAICNLLYCVVTATILFIETDSLSVFGYTYFTGEIAIVMLLSIQEFKYAKISL